MRVGAPHAAFRPGDWWLWSDIFNRTENDVRFNEHNDELRREIDGAYTNSRNGCHFRDIAPWHSIPSHVMGHAKARCEASKQNLKHERAEIKRLKHETADERNAEMEAKQERIEELKLHRYFQASKGMKGRHIRKLTKEEIEQLGSIAERGWATISSNLEAVKLMGLQAEEERTAHGHHKR